MVVVQRLRVVLAAEAVAQGDEQPAVVAEHQLAAEVQAAGHQRRLAEDHLHVGQPLGAYTSFVDLSNVAPDVSRTLTISGTPSLAAQFVDYLVLGVEHIFTGYDHIAFLLGLLLIDVLLFAPALRIALDQIELRSGVDINFQRARGSLFTGRLELGDVGRAGVGMDQRCVGLETQAQRRHTGEHAVLIRRQVTQHDGQRGLVIDAGVNVLFTSFWYDHDVVPAQPFGGLSEPTVMYGPLCMNIDVVRDTVSFPPMRAGDRVVFRNVGAYNVTQWMQFITLRPAVVMVGRDGQVATIRRAELLSDLESLEEVPAWLR